MKKNEKKIERTSKNIEKRDRNIEKIRKMPWYGFYGPLMVFDGIPNVFGGDWRWLRSILSDFGRKNIDFRWVWSPETPPKTAKVATVKLLKSTQKPLKTLKTDDFATKIGQKHF